MTSLTITNDDQEFLYNWDLIEDDTAREVVKNQITEYKQQWQKNLEVAKELVATDTVAKAKCVYEVKQQLGHGQFRDVCQQALGLNKDQAAALVSVHSNVLAGATSEDVLAMVAQMEPRAAAKLLNSDDETKSSHVATFEASGRVPSRRDLTKPKAKNNDWFERQKSQARMEAINELRAEQAFADSPASRFYQGSEEPNKPSAVEPAVEVSFTDLSDSTTSDSVEVEKADPLQRSVMRLVEGIKGINPDDLLTRPDLMRQIEPYRMALEMIAQSTGSVRHRYRR